MTAETAVSAVFSPFMDDPRCARAGETTLSPERKSGWTRVAAKEGAHGGTMGSPMRNLCRCTGYHNIVKAVLAVAEE